MKLERWKNTVVIGSLVLFVVAAALPTEGRSTAEVPSPCSVMASPDPLMEAFLPAGH